MRIIFDIDGVLADFTEHFTREIARVYHTPVVWTVDNKSWGMDHILTQEQIDYGFHIAHTQRYWWMELKPMLTKDTFYRINYLSKNHMILFVTDRKGHPSVQYQTNAWLREQGIENPNVVVSKMKGDIARAFNADFAIEDKLENAVCIHWISNGYTQPYLVDRPYNRHRILGDKNVRRITSVTEFINVLENGTYNL